MSKAERPSPIEEGSAKDIYRWFIGKLLFWKQPDTNMREWLEILFHLKYRDITRYKVMKSFRMPGHFYRSPNVKIQGMGFRDVPVGATLWIRTDARDPDVNDVEWIGKSAQQFCLNSSELGLILLSCEEQSKRDRRAPRDEY